MKRIKLILFIAFYVYILGIIGANEYSIAPIGELIAWIGVGIAGYILLIYLVNLAERGLR